MIERLDFTKLRVMNLMKLFCKIFLGQYAASDN
jgi:hypothetical protein